MKETTLKTSMSSKPGPVAEHFKSTQQCKFHSLFTVKLPSSPLGTELSQDNKIVLLHPTCGSGKRRLRTLKRDRDTNRREGRTLPPGGDLR